MPVAAVGSLRFLRMDTASKLAVRHSCRTFDPAQVHTPAQCVHHLWLRRLCNSAAANRQRLAPCLTQRADQAGGLPPPGDHRAQATPVLAARLRTVQADTPRQAAALARPHIAVLLPASHIVVRERWAAGLTAMTFAHALRACSRTGPCCRRAGRWRGVYPATAIGEEEPTQCCGMERVGDCDGVEELFFALTREKRIEHWLMRRIKGRWRGAGCLSC